jgi:hypothetical protein
MKAVAAMSFVIFVLSGVAFAENDRIIHGTIRTDGINICLASPLFGKALAEATEKANGFKIRIDYTLNHTYRTTSETLVVNVVGKVEGNLEKYAKSTFTLNGTNGCWSVSVSPVTVSAISKEEFVDFKY